MADKMANIMFKLKIDPHLVVLSFIESLYFVWGSHGKKIWWFNNGWLHDSWLKVIKDD